MSSEILLDQALAFVRRSFTPAEAKTVELYGGQFSAEEIPQTSYTCPAIFVTVLGWQEPPSGSRITGRHARQYRLCAFVVFKHADRVKRMSGSRSNRVDNHDPARAAQEIDHLGPRQGDGAARDAEDRYRDSGVLRRSA